MNDKIKLIIMAAGGFLGSFVLFFAIFYFVMSSQEGTAAEAQAPEGGDAAATQQMGGSNAMIGEEPKPRRVAGADALIFAESMGEQIPIDPKIEGYQWAKWGMSMEQVTTGLTQNGQSVSDRYQSPNGDFTNLVVLRPDEMRLKVEYRFFKEKLFHVEIYYSQYYRNTSFESFLYQNVKRYGRPYEQYAEVDELGNIIIHVKWDTEDTLIELISRPNGQYSVFLRSQEIIIQLEEARKAAERIRG